MEFKDVMDTEKVMVSICCITFNHEKYIEDAINGFLMQKTDFNFEILIHDDASTDNTAKIIRKYEEKYPSLIKVIYQKENQYSKGIKPLEILYKIAKGKYIAVCEGDDYWIEEKKLQRQVDYMEKNPNCTFCFTNAIEKNLKTNEERIFIRKKEINERVFNFEDFNLGELAEFDFIPTASFMFPKKVLDNMPNFYYAPLIAGDFKLKLACTSQGYAHFINKAMVVYRVEVPNSVTTIWKKEDNQKIIKRWEEFIDVLDKIDKETENFYHENLDKLRRNYERWILYLKRDKKLLDKRYSEFYKNSSFKDKLVLNLYLRNYTVYKFLKKIKDLI